MTDYPNGVSSFGMPVLGALPPFFGNVYFVDYGAGSDANDGLNRNTPFKTLSAAYAAATSNNDDLILIRGNTTVTETSMLTWSKNRIHVYGVDGTPGRLVLQGAKVQSATATTDAAVIKVTGVRNSFTNIRFIQAGTAATALHVLEEGGEGTLYQNCQFMFGVADNLDLTTAIEVVAGSDSGNYINCVFGEDTLLTSAARAVFLVDQVTSNQEFKSNILRGCIFKISSSSSTAEFVRMAAIGDILFSNYFEDCSFIASIDSAGGAALARAVSTANGTVKGTLLFAYPRVFNCTNFGVNGTNNDNLFVVAPLVVNTDIVGVQPIAT